MSEEKKGKFSKCEEGGEKCLSVEFRVFEKKNGRKVRRVKFFGGNFAKFVFTG